MYFFWLRSWFLSKEFPFEAKLSLFWKSLQSIFSLRFVIMLTFFILFFFNYYLLIFLRSLSRFSSKTLKGSATRISCLCFQDGDISSYFSRSWKSLFRFRGDTLFFSIFVILSWLIDWVCLKDSSCIFWIFIPIWFLLISSLKLLYAYLYELFYFSSSFLRWRNSSLLFWTSWKMIAGRFGSSVFYFFEMIYFWFTLESLEIFLVN